MTTAVVVCQLAPRPWSAPCDIFTVAGPNPTPKRGGENSLCLPSIRREEEVHAAIVDVRSVLQEAVDHVSNRRCSIFMEDESHQHRAEQQSVDYTRCTYLALF